MTPAPCYVGIDVAKARLDIAVRPSSDWWATANDAAGVAALVARLHELQSALVVLEATGGYERPLAAALAGASLPVAVANPRQARDFARATGKLAKTDALDARTLAHFAEAVRPPARPVPDVEAEALGAVLARRRQLVEMRTAEQNRLHTAAGVVGPAQTSVTPGVTALDLSARTRPNGRATHHLFLWRTVVAYVAREKCGA